MAGAAKRQRERALCGDADVGVLMVDRHEQRRRARIVGAAFDPDRTLRRGGQQLVERRADVSMPEPVESRGGKQGRVDLARVALGQPGRDIAADRDDLEVGTEPQQLRGAARRAAADDRTGRQVGDRPRPDQAVADVGAGQHCGDQ